MGLKRVRKELLFLLLILCLVPTSSVIAAVVISSFTATPKQEGILVEWETSSETNNSGFDILRSTQEDGVYENLGVFVLSESISGGGFSYYYLDDTVSVGILYYYKLEVIDMNGNRDLIGPVIAAFGVSTWTPTPTRTPTRSATMPASVTLGSNLTPSPTSTVTLTPSLQLTSTPSPTQPQVVSPTLTVELEMTMTATPEGTAMNGKTPTERPILTQTLLFPGPVSTSTPLLTFTETPEKPPIEVASNLMVTQEGRKGIGLLLGIPILLWICLAVFLFLFVRKITEQFENEPAE